MKPKNQRQIAKACGITDSFLSQIISNVRRPSWKKAKKLAAATGTTPELWLEGTTEQIRDSLNQVST